MREKNKMGWKFKHGKYIQGKTTEQAALTDYRNYHELQEAIGKNGWAHKYPSIKQDITDVLDKLDNFVPAVNCNHCGNPADYLLIKEWKGEYEDTHTGKRVYGLERLSVSHENVLCEDHKTYRGNDDGETSSGIYKIKFRIIEDFIKRNKADCYDLQVERIPSIFLALRKCTGFKGKLTSVMDCYNLIHNLPQKPKQIVQPAPIVQPKQIIQPVKPVIINKPKPTQGTLF
jgi:hypothetical protein